MPDIIDIVLAKALSPSGQIAAAAAKATKAVSDAATAVANIESITEQTNTNNTNAAAALRDAQDAVTAVNGVIENLDSSIGGTIDDEIDKLTLSKTVDTTSSVIKNSISISYPSTDTATIADITKYYTSTGQNTDGAMTQKAITDAINAIDTTPTFDFTSSDAGKITAIDTNGRLVASTITEAELAELLINSGGSGGTGSDEIIGLEIDYENKTFTRLQNAANYTAGSDFNKFNMYGGRKRCNVADNGAISAFYGDNNYAEDGSNGQVMVYQPAFYYLRTILKSETITTGTVIRKERILLSDVAQTGFKRHPLFKDASGNDIDYVLLPAFEGSAYSNGVYILNDATVTLNTAKLSSVSGTRPISGASQNFSITAAEQMAQNRGSGWHITNMLVESAMQMLELVEFGTLNGQDALEAGISSLTNTAGINCAADTGSTSILGNATGHATTTIARGTEYTTAGYRAISYRGVENPWGNTWRAIGAFKIEGDGSHQGGVPYVSTSLNYNDTTAYHALSYYIPYPTNYISGFGYDTIYDWAFIPIEAVNANSALPVGDVFFASSDLNATNVALAGGKWNFDTSNGIFCYSFDNAYTSYGASLNACLLHVPAIGDIHTANKALWASRMG